MARRRGWAGGCGSCALDLIVLGGIAGFVFWKWGPAPWREAAQSRVGAGIRQVRERVPGGPKKPSRAKEPPPALVKPASPAPTEPPAPRHADTHGVDTHGVDTHGVEAAPPAADEARMTRGELGSDWPLTVDEALVSCREDAVYLRVNGVLYAVDGIALRRRAKTGAEDFRASGLWAPDPQIEGFKKSLGPVIDKGLSLCR